MGKNQKDWIRYLKPVMYVLILSPGWFLMFKNARMQTWKYGFAANMSLIMIYLHTIAETWHTVPNETIQNVKLVRKLTRLRNEEVTAFVQRYSAKENKNVLDTITEDGESE